jgi:hypothetical protein
MKKVFYVFPVRRHSYLRLEMSRRVTRNRDNASDLYYAPISNLENDIVNTYWCFAWLFSVILGERLQNIFI